MDKLYDKQMDMETLSNQGFPFCPECCGTLFWENDFMLSEIGYIKAKESEDPDYIDPDDKCVHVLTYAGCGKSFEIEDDGKMILLGVITPKENDDDEPDFRYTQYAIDNYGENM